MTTTTDSTVKESPVRFHRGVEQKNLEELNGRLQTYIMRQRAKDASRKAFENEIADIQQHSQQLVQSNTKKFEEQLRQMRQQRDEHASAREELHIRVNRLEATVGRLKDQVSEEKKYHSELNERLGISNKQLEGAKTQVSTLQDTIRETQRALKASETAGRVTSEQLTEARDLSDQNSHELSSIRSKCKNLEQDLALTSRTNTEEVTKLKAKIESLGSQLAMTEDNCRKEFSSQMETVIEEYRKQCNDDKTRVTRELKAHYMPKLTELRQSLDDTVHREGELRKANTTAMDQVGKLKKEMHALTETKLVHEKRIHELENELDTERNVTHTGAIMSKDKDIEHLRHENQRLQNDYDDLMDVKIQLALTIEQYRNLLHEEEQRLGLETPGRKRKRSKKASEGPVLQLALDNNYSHCLFVKNSGNNSVNLKGWVLKSGESLLEFPKEMTLSSSAEICVWIGDGNQYGEEEAEITWEGVTPEDLTCEPMQLIDLNGTVVDQIEVETVTGQQDGSNCLIM